MPKAKKAGRTAVTAVGGRGAGLVGRARDEAKVLVRDAQKRAEKIVVDFERRAEKLVGTIETRAVKAMEPALKKTFATRRELREMRAVVTELAETVGELARRLG